MGTLLGVGQQCRDLIHAFASLDSYGLIPYVGLLWIQASRFILKGALIKRLGDDVFDVRMAVREELV